MLAGIKKVVLYLSGACVLWIVVEECHQRIQTNRSRLQASHLKSSQHITRTPFHVNVTSRETAADNSPPNASDNINKQTADVSSDEKQDRFADIRRNSTTRLRLSKHRDIKNTNVRQAASVSINNSNTSKTIDTPRAHRYTQLEEKHEVDEEERRLRQSPLIYLEDHAEHTNLAPAVSTSVKLVSYFRPGDAETFRPKNFHICQYKCRYVRNVSQAEAVIFQASKIRDNVIPDFYRPAGQRWIFFTNDPAIKRYDLERPDVKANFNWTMTYQLDSDFPTPFGYLQRRKPQERDYETIYDRKKKQAAWFVSHCSTWGKRELYVQRMRKIMQVDIFGRCGNLSCGPIHYRSNDSVECLPMLTHHYKFYLAFENSFCKDYVSEKFFKLFQNVDVIPVVRGGFDYKRYLPSGIFVDASDFKTPEALADHLVQLGNDKHKYVTMLRKKSQWLEVSPLSFQCRVCQALHTSQPTLHHHPNLRAKFNGLPSNCWLPTDLQ